MSSQRVVLVRHGETAWSRSRRHTGRTDLPLADEGRRQGESLRVPLAGYRFAHVFASPLERAQETARLAGFGAATELVEDLVEWDYGDFEGITTEAIRHDRPGWSIWSGAVPNGETLGQVAARADAVIARVRALATDGDVALFGHAHQLRVLAARWCGLAAAEGRHLQLTTASISVLGWEREDAGIVLWNHVPGEA